MKGLLLLLIIAGVGYLAYDDYSNREALKQSQVEIGRLTLALNQATQGRVSFPRAQTTPAPPSWFQQHLNQGTALDPSKRHTPP